jgi:non-specific serine/threonine protein kinase/serine/threonine-protein kinase
MTSEHWARVRELLEAALEQPEDSRHSFLDAMCGDQPHLRSEIEELLTLETQSEALFGNIGWNLHAIDVLPPGTQMGSYRILNLIGHGGMGSVYSAERADAAYSQQVAIKVVQGHIGSGDALRRFVRERQTLARLNHPGIARLLDGGVTADGRPYLVMEYVEGRPIDKFCDDEKLTVRERIQLLIRICEAVQSAHQNLIVHRDLKPDNILVTSAGDPKLLDFGIAKWLDTVPEEGALTVQILTPSYASPEQASHQPVSTATDVYSLGALLFELLTGSLPHPVAGLAPHEAVRLLTETEPKLASEAIFVGAADTRRTNPKSLKRTLKGDLDTILQHALHREPSRRYRTVEAFAADLNRYLLQLPVLARPDSLLYRIGKFVKRRRAIVAVAAIAFVAITVAAFAVWHGYAVARTQAAIAERRYQNGRKLVQSYLGEVDRKLEAMPGTTDVRNLIAQRNLEYLDRMSADAQGDVPLLRELAQAYFLIARTQRMMAQSSVDREQARINMVKAVQLRRRVFATTGDIVDRGQLAYLLSQLGALMVQSGELRQAIAYHQEACSLAQPVFAQPAKGLNYLRAANACWNLATDYIGNEQAPYAGKFEEGFKGQLDTLARFKHWRDENLDNPIGFAYVASMESMTAGALWRVQRYQEARQHFETALSILHGPHGMQSNELATSYLVMAEVDFSMLLVDSKQYQEALPHARQALLLASKQLAAQRTRDPGWLSVEGFSQAALGRSLIFNGQKREGSQLLSTGLATLRDLYSKDKSDAEAAAALALCDTWAIDGYLHIHAMESAAKLGREVIDLSSAALQKDPIDASATRYLNEAHQAMNKAHSR